MCANNTGSRLRLPEVFAEDLRTKECIRWIGTMEELINEYQSALRLAATIQNFGSATNILLKQTGFTRVVQTANAAMNPVLPRNLGIQTGCETQNTCQKYLL